MHIAQVGDTFFELQVAQCVGPRRMQGWASLREALGRLLAETPKPAGHPKSRKGAQAARPPMSRIAG
jgi:hypothetical protein